MPDVPVLEHPIPWDQLKPYEQQQGGYWLYGPDRDVYGNGRQWISVPRPEQPGELDAYRNQIDHLARRIRTRARQINNPAMAALAEALTRLAHTPGAPDA